MSHELEANGYFITFEGGEGSGKTTQIKTLSNKLEQSGYEVVITREPGGTAAAEKIRDLLVLSDAENWTPMAECLLLFAARNMHFETLIKPALLEGKVVISDRFTDSTRAYQSYGLGVSMADVENIKQAAIGSFEPDLTFIMDIPAEIGLKRSKKRLSDVQSQEDKYENLDLEFHEKLRDGYIDIAKTYEKRCKIINADRTLELIALNLEELTMEALNACSKNLNKT